MRESAQLIKLLLAANKQMHTVKDRANPMPCTSGLDRGKKNTKGLFGILAKKSGNTVWHTGQNRSTQHSNL